MTHVAPRARRPLLALAIAAVSTLASAPFARAGTMVLPQLYPKAFASGVSATYKVETIGSTKVGHLVATGTLDNVMTDASTSTPTGGTFSLSLYFNAAGGVLGTQAGNELLVKNASNASLFNSTQAISTNPTCTASAIKMETLWVKPANPGSLASTSPHPFIGSYIYLPSVTYYTGGTGFGFSTTAAYANNLLFTTTGSTGTANVFMTPTPAAWGGGVALLGAIATRRKRRREA